MKSSVISLFAPISSALSGGVIALCAADMAPLGGVCSPRDCVEAEGSQADTAFARLVASVAL